MAPRPIPGELRSSWVARLAAGNGLTIQHLLDHVLGSPWGQPAIDGDATPSLIAGLAMVGGISEMDLRALGVYAQFPQAPPWAFLPDVYQESDSKRYARSGMLVPSCPACFLDQAKNGVPLHWKAEWSLALAPLCPKHLTFLSGRCHHCSAGSLAAIAHPQNGSIVVRCTHCFRDGAFHSDSMWITPRTQLVANFEEALISACKGIPPDPMWIGRVQPAAFLSLVDDLMWIFLDIELDYGGPLIKFIAPAGEVEMLAGRGLWKYPFSYLPPTHRETVLAAIAVALLGKRVIQHFDILLPVPVNELDLYPVSTALRRVWRGSSSELVERIQRWPFTFQERFCPSVELMAR